MKSRTPDRTVQAARSQRKPRKTAGKPLKASELRFRRLFETAKDGVLVLDGTTHEILEANPCTLELLGRSKGDLLGNRLSDIGILSNESDYQKMFGRLTGERSVRFEHSLRNAKTGQPTELEFVCNSYDEDGRPFIQCNIRDIAERREAERKLRDALEELRTAKQALETRVLERTADLRERNAELEAFSYSLSHDLRAPIRAIVSFTQLALEEFGTQVGPSATEYLEKAISAAQRLDLLILDVLEFSKTTRQKLQTETVDLEPLLQDILEERPEWVERKAEIAIVRPLLPLRGDRASLTQCLTNLLDNAVKFIPAGKVARVRIFTEAIGKRVRLNIVDNGIGIPLSAQPKVFELFQRAHNGYEGHGIGLAIVKRAAERMGGNVGVNSTPDEGSTFWLELPAPDQAPSS